MDDTWTVMNRIWNATHAKAMGMLGNVAMVAKGLDMNKLHETQVERNLDQLETLVKRLRQEWDNR